MLTVNSRFQVLGGTHIWGVNSMHFLMFFVFWVFFWGNLRFWGVSPQEIVGNNTGICWRPGRRAAEMVQHQTRSAGQIDAMSNLMSADLAMVRCRLSSTRAFDIRGRGWILIGWPVQLGKEGRNCRVELNWIHSTNAIYKSTSTVKHRNRSIINQWMYRIEWMFIKIHRNQFEFKLI